MATGDPAKLRSGVMRRLRSAEKVSVIAADADVSASTLYRWRRAAVPALPVEGDVGDMTGPGITGNWGATCADLGVSVVAPNGHLLSVFGDTFSGRVVGQGDWRSPVALVGSGDAGHRIQYEHAGGADPTYARQLWAYVHDDHPWNRGGISTVIPSVVLVLNDTMYLHAIVNRGYGNVIRTGIWSSTANGVSWRQIGPGATFPAALHNGYAQLWSWDYDPDDGWVYIVATGFHRDKGIILLRVRPAGIGDMTRYEGWGQAGKRVGVGQRTYADHAAVRNLG